MILDAILVLLVSMSFYRGWKKGILWAVFSLVAVVIGIFAALKLSHNLSNYLFQNNILTNSYTLLISFILILIVIILIFRLTIKFIEGILEKILLGWANKIIGGLLYSFITVFVISTAIWLFNEGGLLKADFKTTSKTYSYIEPIAPKTIQIASDYVPFMKNLYADIKGKATQLNDKITK